MPVPAAEAALPSAGIGCMGPAKPWDGRTRRSLARPPPVKCANNARSWGPHVTKRQPSGLDGALPPDSPCTGLYIYCALPDFQNQDQTYTTHNYRYRHTHEQTNRSITITMGFSRTSSKESESIQSHHDKKSSLSSRADPNSALNEAQPMASMSLHGTDMFSLRAMQHRDAEGKIITDPDLSNPTRPRLERPLDTIRAFEAAIENRRRENAG